MNQQPLISIIIPAYNNAEFLGEAIGSVLRQTYANFELIIVNDASPDDVEDVINGFNDPRIKYIKHKVNKGLSAARNSGICAATGEYIALLDGDDFFHPDKLKAHVEFFAVHPEIDVTYNPRFDLNHSSTTIRHLWRPPLTVDLADLILGYPFAPSDMIVRRESFMNTGLFDDSLTYYGEDLDINCRLSLAGCKFGSVDRALNFRRFHSRRRIKNLRAYQDDEVRPLYSAFADPRFPEHLSNLKNTALSNRYVAWSIFAYLQDDTDLGKEYSLKAAKLNPHLLDGQPCNIMESILNFSIIDENIDHENLIEKILSHLPLELNSLAKQADWAIGHGYLLRGIRAVLWGRDEDGNLYFEKAAKYGAEITKDVLHAVSAQIISYEIEFGSEVAKHVLEKLCTYIQRYSNLTTTRWLRSLYYNDFAFRNYKLKQYKKVPGALLKAFVNEPVNIINRGLIKMFIKSMINWILPHA